MRCDMTYTVSRQDVSIIAASRVDETRRTAGAVAVLYR
jgi:hypothetical protein